MDQSSVANGIGGVTMGCDTSGRLGHNNVRQKYIQGISSTTAGGSAADWLRGEGGRTPNEFATGVPPFSQATTTGQYSCVKRYQVYLGTGLFTQEKLIPLKFMASQFAIEITLAPADEAIITFPGTSSGAAPTYTIGNVNFLPEILEFDASYDAVFLQGLREGGIPLLFASWHTFIFSNGASSAVNLLVQERSRSVKALFCVQRRAPVSRFTDSHATFFDTSAYVEAGCTMQTYQFRIGGRYYPPSPVQLADSIGGAYNNSGCEAYVELEKALNIVGDYRLSTGCNATRWAVPVSTTSITPAGGLASPFPELDYHCSIRAFGIRNAPVYQEIEAGSATAGNCFAGMAGSCCYVSAVSLETSNGMEISGLNAEEQSDISFIANWNRSQAPGFVLEVYSYYDSMIILRENNVSFFLSYFRCLN